MSKDVSKGTHTIKLKEKNKLYQYLASDNQTSENTVNNPNTYENTITITDKDQGKTTLLKIYLRKTRSSARVIKKDTNNNTIENVKFTLLDSDSKEKEVITDSNGQILLDNLLVGNYTLTEKETVLPYKLDTKPIHFSIREDGKLINTDTKEQYKNNEITVTNGIEYGYLKLLKYGKDDENNRLNTTKFKISYYCDYDNSFVDDTVAPTATKKQKNFSNLSYEYTTNTVNEEKGIYKIEEISAPTGYLIADTHYMKIDSVDEKTPNVVKINDPVTKTPDTTSNASGGGGVSGNNGDIGTKIDGIPSSSGNTSSTHISNNTGKNNKPNNKNNTPNVNNTTPNTNNPKIDNVQNNGNPPNNAKNIVPNNNDNITTPKITNNATNDTQNTPNQNNTPKTNAHKPNKKAKDKTNTQNPNTNNTNTTAIPSTNHGKIPTSIPIPKVINREDPRVKKHLDNKDTVYEVINDSNVPLGKATVEVKDDELEIYIIEDEETPVGAILKIHDDGTADIQELSEENVSLGNIMLPKTGLQKNIYNALLTIGGLFILLGMVSRRKKDKKNK